MITKQTLRYLIPKREVPDLIDKIRDFDGETIMEEKLMIRSLFRYANQKDGSWVRIRVGDMTINHDEVCEITHKQKVETVHGRRESVIGVRVEDYDSAVALLQQIGLVRQSIQENRRSKYICEYNDDKYVVSIDEWPGLDDSRFVIIQPISSIEHETLREFAEALNLTKKKRFSYSIDDEYKRKLNIIVSDLKELNFRTIDEIKRVV